MKALIALLPQALRRSLLGRLPALLALLATGLLAIARLSAGGAEQAVVGLALPAAPSPEAELAAALLTSPDAPLPFRLSTETEAREAVAAGRWDCAFLLGRISAPAGRLPSCAREALSWPGRPRRRYPPPCSTPSPPPLPPAICRTAACWAP